MSQANAGGMQPVPELRCGIQLVRTEPDLLVTLWLESDALPSCLLRLTLDAEGWRVVTVGTVPRPVPDEEESAETEEEANDANQLEPDAPDQLLSVADPLL